MWSLFSSGKTPTSTALYNKIINNSNHLSVPSDKSVKFSHKMTPPPLTNHNLIEAAKLCTITDMTWSRFMGMEGELNNFILVWISAAASLCYCHAACKFAPSGPTRLVCFLPVVCLFLALPLRLTSLTLCGLSSFFLAWLANFKLLLLAFGKGPLSSDPPLFLPRFLSIACLPIKPQPPQSQYEVANKVPLPMSIWLVQNLQHQLISI